MMPREDSVEEDLETRMPLVHLKHNKHMPMKTARKAVTMTMRREAGLTQGRVAGPEVEVTTAKAAAAGVARVEVGVTTVKKEVEVSIVVKEVEVSTVVKAVEVNTAGKAVEATTAVTKAVAVTTVVKKAAEVTTVVKRAVKQAEVGGVVATSARKEVKVKVILAAEVGVSIVATKVGVVVNVAAHGPETEVGATTAGKKVAEAARAMTVEKKVAGARVAGATTAEAKEVKAKEAAATIAVRKVKRARSGAITVEKKTKRGATLTKARSKDSGLQRGFIHVMLHRT